jgi:hypothetical protein
LKANDHQAGAFYTPRFLAEIVLDSVLEGSDRLSGKAFLDPACGSGIFLVGLFNRIAEEWKHANPNARNDRRARELMQVLQESLFGIDINPTACRITAFSLYLAYLDQLSPRDIQELQAKGRALPHLVGTGPARKAVPNIQCVDFFSSELKLRVAPSMVVGNPPWGSIATPDTPAGRWCAEHKKSLPDNQIAGAFVWKAASIINDGGRICFVLPHGALFNHGDKAVEFQKAWLTQNTVEKVLNLADFRWFLFEKAVHPAIIVRYSATPPKNPRHQIEYLAPKVDWFATQAEIISVSSIDRSRVYLSDLVKDLDGPDAPQTWKQRFWATPRDLRLLDRLSLYPRLRDHVRGPREGGDKPWVMAEGFQPLGPSDDPEQAKLIQLPSKFFIDATSPAIDLFLLPEDCRVLRGVNVTVRNRSNKSTDVFHAPHVLITKGFQRIAFCDFPVSFRHALRGIHGPEKHRMLLMFLAAYLRSRLAKYFMFHTSSSWGMYRPEGHVEEVLRLPMPLPGEASDSSRHKEIIERVAGILDTHSRRAHENFIVRANSVREATDEIEPLIEDYFDIQSTERVLLSDTLNIVIPSIQPTQARMPVPTVEHSTEAQRAIYMRRLCETLNSWSKGTDYVVKGRTTASDRLGIGLTVLQKVARSEALPTELSIDPSLLQTLDRLRKIASPRTGTLTPTRGIMVFDQNRLYLLRLIGQRYWTETAALNDADEIAGTILMHTERASA